MHRESREGRWGEAVLVMKLDEMDASTQRNPSYPTLASPAHPMPSLHGIGVNTHAPRDVQVSAQQQQQQLG